MFVEAHTPVFLSYRNFYVQLGIEGLPVEGSCLYTFGLRGAAGTLDTRFVDRISHDRGCCSAGGWRCVGRCRRRREQFRLVHFFLGLLFGFPVLLSYSGLRVRLQRAFRRYQLAYLSFR